MAGVEVAGPLRQRGADLGFRRLRRDGRDDKDREEAAKEE
jgi:hypothetical protein